MMKGSGGISRRIIFQVFLATIPFFLAGLFLGITSHNASFERLSEIHQQTHQAFVDDTRELEQALLNLNDRNHRYLAQIRNYEYDKQTENLRTQLYQKAYELKGEKIVLASTLIKRAIDELSQVKGITAETLKERLIHILDGLVLEIHYWDGRRPLRELFPPADVSADFFDYAAEALKKGRSDWFEDHLGRKDVVVSLVPYPQGTVPEGLFIAVFDLTEAYSYAERAERTALNQESVREQENRFLDAQKKREELLEQRQRQARFVEEKRHQRNQIFTNSKNDLIVITVISFTGMIAASLFLFWFFGTRKVTRLNDWLRATSRALEQLPPVMDNADQNAAFERQQQLNRILEQRMTETISNEIGELSHNINFLLETIQRVTVTKDSLVREIGAKEQLTRELSEQKERLALILAAVQSGLVIVDPATGRIVDLNPAALDLLGAARDEILLMNYDELFDLSPLNQASCDLEAGRLDNYEVLLSPLNRQPISVLRSDRVTTIGDRKTLISSLVDIEDIKKSREQLEQAKAAAEQANRMKSEFLANMSHEIRTPLNGVIGMTQLLYESKMTTDQQRICQTIHAEADSLLRIISEILDFSKIEAGKIDLEYIPFSPRQMVEQLTENLALRMPAKGIEALSYVPTDIPEILIGDPGRLQQILTNLGNNALKFTHKGQIYVHVERVEQRHQQLLLKFLVEDTGIGIPVDKQERIFASFTQADGSTTRKYGGTGLGTTIAKQLVELMGGEIGLISEEGEGSTFWFTLSFAIAENQNQLPRPENDLLDKNILVIEDNVTNLLILERYLKSFGCRVQLCGDPNCGLNQLKQAEPCDLVICDYNLPRMNGLQLVEKLRAGENAVNSRLPVIILSSYHTIQQFTSSTELSIQGLLCKPVRKAELEKLIRLVLGAGQVADGHPGLPGLVQQSSAEEARQRARAKKHLLLVEDYPTNQQIALRYLTHCGYKVTLAENGIEAVDQSDGDGFDLILMDIQMPQMDGYEATRAIRAREREQQRPRVPIVAMTAHASSGFRDQCLRQDMDDYLSKPIRKESFINKVDQWLIPELASTELNPREEDLLDNGIFDYHRALEAFVDDIVFLEEVVQGFLLNLDNQLGLLRDLIVGKQLQAAADAAHSIKGGSYNLYATRLGQAAELLEKSCRADQPDAAGKNFSLLCSQVDEFKHYLDRNRFFLRRTDG